ncbi:hypothetical protein K439DRAFT_1657135 [Ramaria rubella]|nr:hypothetical protein K439DRAFT_1657135 [Ramaria rubella]
MDRDIGAVLDALTEGVEHLRAARCYILAPVVVLYFDWLLTLPLEIDRFWTSRVKGPTVLFLLNRYFPIVSLVPEMTAYFTGVFSPKVCEKHVIPFVIASNIISQSLIGIVLLLRTYALYDRSLTILVITSTGWAAALAVGIWAGSSLVPITLPPGVSGCLPHIPDDMKYRFASAYMASLLYDALIYALTLQRTLALRRIRALRTRSGNSLICLIIRDDQTHNLILFASALLGTNLISIFFICLAEVCFYYYAISLLVLLYLTFQSDLRTINVTFNHIIPVTIVSRLLLNLRKDMHKGHAQSSSRSTNTAPDMTFATSLSGDILSVVIGNIGEEFEDEDKPSTPRHSWSLNSESTTSAYYPESIRDSESEVHGIEMIQVSELRMERERIFGWDQIWAAGVNG